MARVHPFQSNFTAGELTPKLAGQIDFKKYANGLETLQNMTVFPQGGAARRYGTRFVGPVKNHSQNVRLIPFEFNVEQSYCLEFGHQYLRFYKDNGIITENDKTITGITQANPAVVTASSHGYSNGDEVIITAVNGMTQINGKRYKVANKTTNTFQVTDLDGNNINSTSFTAYASGGDANKIYEISTNITESMLYEIQFTQSADIMYIVHETIAPQKLSRTGHTSWTIGNETFTNGPFLDDGTTAAWSGSNGYPRTVSFYEQRLVFGGSTKYPQTIWASQSGSYTDFDVGSGNAADAFIYTIAANKVNVIRWLAPARDLIVGTAGGEFKVGRPAGEPLKPDNVTITQQTTYGGWTTEPIQVGNVVLFVQKERKKVREFAYRFEDDAYSAPDMCLLATHITGTGIVDVTYAQEPESIYWAVRDDGLLIGMTYQREEDVIAWHRHVIGGHIKHSINTSSQLTSAASDSDNNGFFTITGHGYVTGDPVEYDNNGNANIGGLVDGTIYYVIKIDNNTIELARTYKQAVDRTVHQIGTGSGTHIIKNHAKVKSIASFPVGDTTEVWMVVERIVNGSKVKYVEYLDPTLNMDSTLNGIVNGASGTLSNLDHLEGESVQVLVGDAVFPNQTVTNGEISVSLPSTSGFQNVEIGLGYTSKMVTMSIEAGANAGTAQNRPKRWNEVAVRLFETVGVTVNGDQIPFRSSSTPVGQNIPPFTGDKRVTNTGWDRQGKITIEQTQPLPMTVLGVTGTLVTSD